MKQAAPHSGHVSNFCHPVGPVIEPMDDYRFERDPCEPLTRVHGGHRVWTRFELAEGSPTTSGMRPRYDQSAQISKRWGTRDDLQLNEPFPWAHCGNETLQGEHARSAASWTHQRRQPATSVSGGAFGRELTRKRPSGATSYWNPRIDTSTI